MMKAIVWTQYGPPDVLRLQEVEKPSPKDNEVLIKVHATTVTAGDCEARSMKFPPLFWLPLRILFGLAKPTRIRILGQELAGEIEAVGKGIARFKEGDPVFASTSLRFGAYAEYVCLPESYVMRKPTTMSFEEAATIPTGGINALHFLKTANVQPGERVLINGAGGSIGTYAVQIAKLFGAEVTCVDNGSKLEMLAALGADHLIDYTQEDFTKRGERYDVIIDVVSKAPFARSVRALTKNGRYVLGVLTLPRLFRGLWVSMTTNKKVITALASYRSEDFVFLTELIEAGKLKAVIDRRYPLAEIAEAHRYVEAGHKKGNVVISVAPHA